MNPPIDAATVEELKRMYAREDWDAYEYHLINNGRSLIAAAEENVRLRARVAEATDYLRGLDNPVARQVMRLLDGVEADTDSIPDSAPIPYILRVQANRLNVILHERQDDSIGNIMIDLREIMNEITYAAEDMEKALLAPVTTGAGKA